jgi:phenylacetaldehyde dehydrogenase
VATPSQSVRIPDLTDYVDGEFSTPSVELGVWLENPNTGERSQQQRATSDTQLEKALAAAWRVHESGQWAKMPIEERVGYLGAMSAELEKRKARIAELEAFSTGVIHRLTSLFGLITTGAWPLAAEQLKSGWTLSTLPGPNAHTVEVHRKPWGPALLLTPFNAPAPMAAHKLANALAAGCPAILKPTEWAPYGCDVFAEAAHAAGLPKGVFQIVHGGAEVGQKLVSDPRLRCVSFTGGLAGGRAIAQACAYDFKPAQLELGGNSAVVVLADANLDEAAQGVVSLMTSLNGQWCRALGRLIVHESLQDRLLEAVLERLGKLKIGDSVAMETEMGPLVHSGHLKKIGAQRDALLAKGGRAHTSARLPDGDLARGNFIAPTLITGVVSADAQDEIFGPVGTVHPFRTEAEALGLANGTPYGLEAYVFGGDEEGAMALAREVRAGGVKVNGSSIMSLSLMAPRPAWGLSGMSEEGTFETFRFFCGTRVVGVEGPLNFN